MQSRISVLMPVYNAGPYLAGSLQPLLAMRARGEIGEVIVIDDGSSDDSPAIAADQGATVLSAHHRQGPGAARNLGVEHAAGDIVWFVDADVVVHEDAARVLAQGFMDPAVVAVFGSYDDVPAAGNFLSQYKNLVHHHYHQGSDHQASTFWAGCGAVRKEAFLAVGGFDVARYPYPSIEDIELGYRLKAQGGGLRLLPDMLGTHLKRWRLLELVHTEVRRRALPWSRLILAQGMLTNDLNIGTGERWRAALAAVGGLALLAALVGIIGWWAVLLLLGCIVLANSRLIRLFLHRHGPLFALRGLLFHQFYYLYSAATFGYASLEALVSKSRNRDEDRV